jgi:succinyl-diaminopimelate desuccinylase
MGKGAADIVPKVTLNIGVIEGGLKVNMVPSACRFEADIRLSPASRSWRWCTGCSRAIPRRPSRK